jgi:hypothetical protein
MPCIKKTHFNFKTKGWKVLGNERNFAALPVAFGDARLYPQAYVLLLETERFVNGSD